MPWEANTQMLWTKETRYMPGLKFLICCITKVKLCQHCFENSLINPLMYTYIQCMCCYIPVINLAKLLHEFNSTSDLPTCIAEQADIYTSLCIIRNYTSNQHTQHTTHMAHNITVKIHNP